jgi:hypothetical protein
MTPIICVASLLLSWSEKLVFFLWIRSKRVPSLTSSIAMQRVGGFVIAPTISTMLG